MASVSWCKETDEKINYTKLCRLLVDGGTQAVRSVFDGIHSPSSLKATLNANKTALQKLKKPKGKVLNTEQWDKLYPPSGSNPTSEDFDITLLFVLLRNICGLTPPATGWDVLPPVKDTSREANLARIKYYRNNTIAHKSSTKINDTDFKQHWQDISSALLSLGLRQDDIDDLKSASLGKKDYSQLLDDWYISDKDVKTQLEEVKSDTSDIKSDTAGIRSDTTDIKSDTAEMKNKLDDITRGMRNLQIQKLAMSDFRSEINTKCKSFNANTRQWILDKVKSHVYCDQPDSCIMLITAGPGMGKSTLAAKICQTYKDLGCLAGCHFFQFSNSTRNNPRLMLQSIARQMSVAVPGYREALESKLQTSLGKTISEMNCEELLTILLEEPMCNVEQPDSNLIVVIDALDECSYDPKDELLRALRKKLPCFPSWLRFVLTSRPSTNTSALGSTVAVNITSEDQRNIKDLELFFAVELKVLYSQCHDDGYDAGLVQKLVEMTKGLFIVAFFVIDYLKRNNVTSPEKVLELFPNGISSVYENYFSRLKDVLLPYITEEERFYKVLEAVVATKNPLPKEMFYNILRLKSEREVPRQERKTRKDALNTLHWLFPVEGDHVTAFHKSVFDWLTLHDDEEHDFSVRVEDGNEVLFSQCNDVLSDIRNGNKDLDKPLNLTDSEKYAVSFLCHLVEKRSSVAKTDKFGFFSNIYLLTALKLEGVNFASCLSASDEIISSSLLGIIGCINICFPKARPHDPSCHFFGPRSFGRYLAFVLQAAHAEGVSEETMPKPLDALNKYLFPYFCESTLLKPPIVVMKRREGLFPVLSFSFQYLFKCKEGFIAVLPIHCSDLLSTAVYMFQTDGCLIRWKSFLGKKLITTSPNTNFIVVAEEKGKRIEILDVTTLEVVSQYESPHDAIETCHVFGDDQGCFIVIKGCHDNKVYVIEGLTGQIRNTITVTEDSTVMDVSCQGHIFVTRTWKRYEPEERNSFTSNDGEVEMMNWKIQHADFASPRKSGLQTPSKVYFIYTYRELSLYHYGSEQEPIPIHPLAGKICHCPYILPEINVDDAIHLSEDGRLLAYHYKNSIFMVNTSDGSLFKRWSFDETVSCLDILFVSRSYLVILDQCFMSVINVQTDEIEHKIYLHYPVFPNTKQYLLFPKKDGKSFDLISNHFKPGSYEVSRLEFQNFNFKGLQ